jgi:hypothetical protein
MTTTQLLNSVVDLSVSDPWAFGSECGPGPFPGKVTDVTEDALLVRLDSPLRYQGGQLIAVIVRPRYTGESTGMLTRQRRLTTNFLFLTRDVSSFVALCPSEDGVSAIGSAIAR